MIIPTTGAAARTTSLRYEMTTAELENAGLLHADENTTISRFAVFVPADEFGDLRPVVIGRGAVINAFAVIHGGTRLGENARIEECAVVGKPERGYAVGQIHPGHGDSTEIGTDTVIRCGAVVYAEVEVGSGTVVGHHSLAAHEDERLATCEFTALPTAAGEALLFDTRLLHRSAPNSTGNPRIGLNIVYSRPDAYLRGSASARAGWMPLETSVAAKEVAEEPYSPILVGRTSCRQSIHRRPMQ